MWDQKKANAPQVYPPLYGHNPSGQLPQSGLQQPFQSMPSPYPPSMAPQMTHPYSSTGMAQGLGPPPPYTPYPEPQQQMKYMQQMGYNPSQYMPTTTGAVSASSFVPQHQQPSMGAAGGHPHSYPYPSASHYPNPSLYPYNPYSNPNLPTNSAVVMPQGFDAGARFDGISRPIIPPPPPGVAPNAAQLAAMQGSNVVIGQKKGSFLEGGSSGGYTFW